MKNAETKPDREKSVRLRCMMQKTSKLFVVCIDKRKAFGYNLFK